MTYESERPARPFAVLATVLPATFMQLVDLSIVNVAIPSLQRELGASYGEVQLVVAGYQLAFACVLITGARLGDIFGRKRVFALGMIGFIIMSAVCGAAPSSAVLVISRILQGMMSGLMFPQVISVIQVTFEPAARGRAFGFYGATIGLAAITGPLLGGLLIAADLFGLDWRIVFYVNVPIGLAALVAAIRYLPESRAPGARRLDILGAVLVTVGLFLLIFPLTEGRDAGWPRWIFVMLIASAVLLAAFVALQLYKTARDRSPLIYTTLFADRGFRRGLCVATAVSASIPAFFLTFTLYLQIGLGYTPLEAGLTTFPFAFGSATASLNSDKLVRRFGVRTMQAGAVILASTMLILRSLSDADLSAWQFGALLLFSGLGLGMLTPPLSNYILYTIGSREVGSASGVMSTAQQVGGSLGVAAVGILFFQVPGLVEAGTAATERRVAFEEALASALWFPAACLGLSVVLLHWLAQVRREHGPQARERP